MGNMDFLEMVLQERIAMLLCRPGKKAEDDWFDQAEEIFSRLDGEDRRKVTLWQDQLCGREAENQKKAYLGGVQDGICLSAFVMSTGMKEIWRIGEMYEKEGINRPGSHRED